MGEISTEARTAFEALTPRERECLRLVARHHQSKEIARLLNISKSTVDKHIDSARTRIGAADRRAAALALVAHEMSLGTGYPSDPAPIPKAPAPRSVEPQFNTDPGAFSDRHDHRPADFQSRVPGQLVGSGIGAEPAGQPGPGRPDLDGDLRAAPAATLAAAGEAAGADPQRHGLADLRRDLLLRIRGGVHDLTPLRLLTLVALIAIIGSLLLGGVLMGAHEVALLVQRIVDGVVPPRG
jgi:DNA-binding CsgD family transcriptional regulator